MTIEDQMVDFHKYCKTCKHELLNENACPCNDCLDNPTNVETMKPVNWEPKTRREIK